MSSIYLYLKDHNAPARFVDWFTKSHEIFIIITQPAKIAIRKHQHTNKTNIIYFDLLIDLSIKTKTALLVGSSETKLLLID